MGTKTFAFTGIGGKSNISLALGNRNAKATKTPYSAPEAPTITELKVDNPSSKASLPICYMIEYERSLVSKKVAI